MQYIRIIRALLLATFLCLSSFTCKAQWGWLIEDIIGNVIEKAAGEIGASDANAAIEKSINDHSMEVKSSLSGYYKAVNTLMGDSRKNASGVLSRSILRNEATCQNDLNFVYKGLFSTPAVSDSLMWAFAKNLHNVSGISISIAAQDSLTVEDLLGKDIYCNWTNKTSESESKLRNDLYEDLDLIAFFRNVPEALLTYSMIYNSDIRLSKEFLMYSSMVSGKMSSAWGKIWAGYSWGDGSDVTYRTSASGEAIDIMRKGILIAQIKENGKNGFEISCIGESHDLLNLYPFANSIYTKGRCSWKTDKEGRVVFATVTIESPSLKVKRNVIKGMELSYLKNNYSTMGFATKQSTVSSDQELYLIPIGMGGGEDLINSIPINTEVINSDELKELDKEVAKYSKKGVPITRFVSVVYGNSRTMRPLEVSISQSVGDLTPKKITFRNR